MRDIILAHRCRLTLRLNWTWPRSCPTGGGLHSHTACMGCWCTLATLCTLATTLLLSRRPMVCGTSWTITMSARWASDPASSIVPYSRWGTTVLGKLHLYVAPAPALSSLQYLRHMGPCTMQTLPTACAICSRRGCCAICICMWPCTCFVKFAVYVPLGSLHHADVRDCSCLRLHSMIGLMSNRQSLDS